VSPSLLRQRHEPGREGISRHAAKIMIKRTEERFDIEPERLAADTAYGSGANLNWLVTDKRSTHPGDRQVEAR
jgi:hypothetical protein